MFKFAYLKPAVNTLLRTYVKNKDVQTWDIFYLCVDLVCVFVFVWGYQAIRGLNFFSKSIL